MMVNARKSSVLINFDEKLAESGTGLQAVFVAEAREGEMGSRNGDSMVLDNRGPMQCRMMS